MDHPSDSADARTGMNPWRITLTVLMGVLVGLGLFTFRYGEGHSYFSSDPTACVNCHIMQPQYDSWQKASHHTVATCVDCHLPHSFVAKWLAKGENGFLHSKAFTFQDFHEPIFIRERNQHILQDNCLQCHGGLVHDIVTPAATSREPVNCIHCHRSAGHGETVGMGKIEVLSPSEINQWSKKDDQQ